MTIDNNTILHYKPIYSTMQGKNIQEGGIGGGGVAKTVKPQQNVPKTPKPCPNSLKTETAMSV